MGQQFKFGHNKTTFLILNDIFILKQGLYEVNEFFVDLVYNEKIINRRGTQDESIIGNRYAK